MTGLAIFGLVMMAVIAMALQHLANFLFRESDDPAAFMGGIVMLVSMVILYAMVMLAINTF